MKQTNGITKLRDVVATLSSGKKIKSYEAISAVFTADTVARLPRLVWLDAELFRICIDEMQPTMAEKSLGKVSAGLYLRDISEVREGVHADSFIRLTASAETSINKDCCLALVGSEATYCLELFNEDEKTWFANGIRLLMNYIITDDERSSRKYRIWEHLGVSRPVDPCPDQAVRFKTVLQLGLQVKCHRRFDEVIIPAVVRYTMEDTLTLEFRKSYLLGLTKTIKLNLALIDISEIRPGSHSYGFVETKSTELYSLTLSIIGSQQVFELEFISLRARDLFADRLFHFVLENISNNPQHQQQLLQRDRRRAFQQQQTMIQQMSHRDLDEEDAGDGNNDKEEVVEHKMNTPLGSLLASPPPPPPASAMAGESKSTFYNRLGSMTSATNTTPRFAFQREAPDYLDTTTLLENNFFSPMP